MPRPSHSRAVATVRSTAQPASRASPSSGQEESDGAGSEKARKTSAGPTANQASPIAVISRSGCARPNAVPSTIPAPAHAERQGERHEQPEADQYIRRAIRRHGQREDPRDKDEACRADRLDAPFAP